jgi:hypothetical protein
MSSAIPSGSDVVSWLRVFQLFDTDIFSVFMYVCTYTQSSPGSARVFTSSFVRVWSKNNDVFMHIFLVRKKHLSASVLLGRLFFENNCTDKWFGISFLLLSMLQLYGVGNSINLPLYPLAQIE